MLKILFNVATKTSNDSIHRVIIKQEVEDIGKPEIQFLDVMKSTKMKYFICFSPCQCKSRKSSLCQTDLDFEFDKKKWRDKMIKGVDMIKKLQMAGILSELEMTADIFK